MLWFFEDTVLIYPALLLYSYYIIISTHVIKKYYFNNVPRNFQDRILGAILGALSSFVIKNPNKCITSPKISFTNFFGKLF
jgi:hypothetical protein